VFTLGDVWPRFGLGIGGRTDLFSEPALQRWMKQVQRLICHQTGPVIWLVRCGHR
ncbi:uncharacterized protein METZ01_LOCUS293024, partial [marine metagenome]